MNESSPRIRNLTLALSTLAAITLAFVGYYYFYVQNQDQKLDERNHRVLSQIRDNAIRKNKTYVQNAVNNSPRDIRDLKFRVIDLINEDIRRENARYAALPVLPPNPDLAGSPSLAEVPLLRRDSVPAPSPYQESLFSKAANVEVRREEQAFVVTETIQNTQRTRSLSFEEWQARSNRLNQLRYLISPDTFQRDPVIVLDSIRDTMAAFTPWQVNYSVWVKDTVSGQRSEAYKITMSIGLRQFFAPLERPDIFDGMILIRKKDVEGPDGKKKTRTDLIYSSIDQPRIANYLVNESDRLLGYAANDSARLGPLTDLPYRIYDAEMVFQGSKLLLIGLAAEDRMDRERLGISTVAVLTMSLLALLVLLGFPLLKLVTMGNYERLSLSDLVLAVMSAILGVFVLTQLLIDGYGYGGPDRKRRNQQLIEMSNQVTKGLETELREIRLQLNQADTLATTNTSLKDNTLVWANDSLANNLSKYPYFQSIYWTGPGFQLMQEWATGPELAPKIRLSDRTYLTELEAGRGWQLPTDKENQLPAFRLESLVARTTGEQLAVVSIPSSKPAANAVFLTTRLLSLHDPILPPSFGFAVVDETGNVWFHSDSRRNLQENFLDETDEPSLQAAMNNRAPLRISGSYLGKDHDFYLRPLEGMPLHLVVFRETGLYLSTHAQILSTTLILILAAFLAGISFILIQSLVNPRSPLLKNDQFVFDWLRPDRSKKKSYRALILINICNLALAIICSLSYQHGLPVLFMIGLLYIYTFILAFLKLNRNAHQEFMWEEHKRIVITTGILLVVSNMLFWVLLEFENYFNLFLFQLVPFIFLVREVSIILRPDAVLAADSIRRKKATEEWESSLDQNKKTLRDIMQKKGVMRGWRYQFYRMIGWANKWLEKAGAAIEAGFKTIAPRDVFAFFHASMSYRIFLLSWLIILSVFPVIRFYEFAYNQESRRLIKYGQIQLIKAAKEREAEMKATWEQIHRSRKPDSVNQPFEQRPLAKLGIYTQPFYNTLLHATIPTRENREEELIHYSELSIRRMKKEALRVEDRDSSQLLPAYQVFDSALSILRPYYTNEARLTHRLPSNTSPESNLIWKEYDILPIDATEKWYKRQVKSILVRKRIIQLQNGDQISISSDLPFYRLPWPFSFISGSKFIFWGLALAFILSIYFLIKFTVRRFFAIDFVEQTDPSPHASTLALARAQHHLFLTIPPRAMAQTYVGFLENIIPWETALTLPREAYLFDLRRKEDWERLSSIIDPQTETKAPALPFLLIDHPESSMETAEGCRQLLDLLEALLKLGPLVALISTETPVDLQAAIVAQLQQGQDAAPAGRTKAMDEARCSRVFGTFTRMDYPLPVRSIVQYGHEQDLTRLQQILDKSALENSDSPVLFRHFFLTPAVLNLEIKNYADSQASQNKGQQHPLAQLVDFDISTNEGRSVLQWQDGKKGKDTFLFDDTTSASQIKTFLARMVPGKSAKKKGPAIVYSTLTTQELHQILIKEETPDQEAIRHWERLMHRSEFIELAREFRQVPVEERVAEIVREECMQDPFLQGLQRFMRQHLYRLDQRLNLRLDEGRRAGDRALREAVIVEVEQQAHLYYQALWNTCSEAEQYLIYDLAQDGLVNTHNRTSINNLIRKGLVRRGTDSLLLLNQSFRNFVLTVVDEAEALKMERKIRQEGTWNRIRVPISLILVAFAVFIFYFQADWFNDTLGLLTAVAAIIPALSNVLERLASLPVPGLSQLSGIFKRKS